MVLLFFPLFAHASTYTLSWCAVKPVSPATFVSYTLCVESSPPVSDVCLGKQYVTSQGPSISFDYPDFTDAWLRVNAGESWWTFNPFKTHLLMSAWSNTVHLIGGLTPPAIGGCP